MAVENIQEKYSRREPQYEEICLADYAAEYTEKKEENGFISLHKREKARILRYTHYAKEKDAANYYREQCALFLPWRNERYDIERMDCKLLYEENQREIESISKKYNALTEEQAKRLNEHAEVQHDSDDDSDDEDELQKQMRQEQEVLIDLFEQGGKIPVLNKKKTKPRYCLPKKISTDDVLKHLEKLNEKHRTFVMHVYKCLKTGENVPFQLYLAGSAGVGKSK